MKTEPCTVAYSRLHIQDCILFSSPQPLRSRSQDYRVQVADLDAKKSNQARVPLRSPGNQRLAANRRGRADRPEPDPILRWLWTEGRARSTGGPVRPSEPRGSYQSVGLRDRPVSRCLRGQRRRRISKQGRPPSFSKPRQSPASSIVSAQRLWHGP